VNSAAIAGLLFAVPGGHRLVEFELVFGTPGNTGYDKRLIDFATLEHIPALLGNRSIFPTHVVIAADGRDGYFPDGLLTVPQVRRVDLNTGAVLGAASAPGLSVAAVAALPHPVEALAVQIVERSITLSWQLPTLSPAASAYRLAIGSQPGASDLGSITLGASQSFTATGVPPGRYFVRLHTVNHTGESDASSEVVVDVP
jgi:hypothetical protein